MYWSTHTQTHAHTQIHIPLSCLSIVRGKHYWPISDLNVPTFHPPGNPLSPPAPAFIMLSCYRVVFYSRCAVRRERFGDRRRWWGVRRESYIVQADPMVLQWIFLLQESNLRNGFILSWVKCGLKTRARKNLFRNNIIVGITEKQGLFDV